MQQAAPATLPPAPTAPEEYMRSVNDVIARVKAIEESVKLQHMFFWLLAGLLSTTGFVVPGKFDARREKSKETMVALDDSKKALEENRSSLETLKKNHHELQEQFKKMCASTPSSPPADAATSMSSLSTTLNSAPVAADVA